MYRSSWPLNWMKTGARIAANDPHFASVKLLLGFEGADGSTTIPDLSSVARGNASVFGNAQIDTAQFKFETSSLLLDGNDDRITFGDSADWLFGGTDAFTIEAWIRFNSLTGFQTICAQWDTLSSNQSWLFDFPGSANNVLRFAYSTTGANAVAVQGAWTPSANTWYHVAVDKTSAGTLRVYANGSMVASATSVPAFANSGIGLRIGTILSAGVESNDFNGWIDELRITKGVARYASDSGYSVPTAAYPRS
jgi:hypothetical protein